MHDYLSRCFGTEMNEQGICTASHLNHVCIAVHDIEDTLRFYRDIFGVSATKIEKIVDQGVLAAIVSVGGSQLEFIQPVDTSGSVARFLRRRGESIHHLCFEVEDLPKRLQQLTANGIELIDNAPRKGLAGMVSFIHPHSTRGVLIELVDRGTTRK